MSISDTDTSIASLASAIPIPILVLIERAQQYQYRYLVSDVKVLVNDTDSIAHPCFSLDFSYVNSFEEIRQDSVLIAVTSL